MAYNLGQIGPEERTGLVADPRDEEYAQPPRRVLRIAVALAVQFDCQQVSDTKRLDRTESNMSSLGR